MPLPILIFIFAVPAVWLSWFVQGNRLFYAFRDRYPEEAEREIQHAFDSWAHPSKFFYFLSAKCATFLHSKKDDELAGRRRTVILLTVAAVAIPFGGMALLGSLIAAGVIR